MKPAAVERAERALGRLAVDWRPVVNRIASSNERWLVRFEDCSSAFVKAAYDEDSARWLRTELVVYAQLAAPFLPRLLGWDDGPPPLLVLEDLGDAYWPPPWSRELVDRVLETLAEVAGTAPPDGLPRLKDYGARLTGGWEEIAADPEAFLSLGVCSRDWLDAALPALVAAAGTAELNGESLVHFDVRSDNLCLRGEQVLLVDWNWAGIGNPLLDVVAWLPSLAVEGGPAPLDLLPAGEGAELAAVMAGFFGARAGLPPPPTAPLVRDLQRAQLEVALPWVVEGLGLPPLDDSAIRSPA